MIVYTFRLIYKWQSNPEWLVISGATLNGAGFSGYPSFDDVTKEINQWLNRAAGNATIISLFIDNSAA